MAVIQARGLTKRYGAHLAVDGLHLTVGQGEIYGFLGPNGAGKTTTIMMILGLERPTAGEVSVFGGRLDKDRALVRSRVGFMGESQRLYENMTAREYLGFFADFYSVRDKEKKVDEVLSRVGLYEVRNRFTGAFSRGMRQKLAMARVLLHDPDLLILDEPVSGLDPHGVKEIRDIILEENSKGKSVLISSHILSEIEKTCHRVGIISKGRLIAEDTMAGIKRSIASEIKLEIILESVPNGLLERIESMPFVKSTRADGYTVWVTVEADCDHRGEVSRAVTESGAKKLNIRMDGMSMSMPPTVSTKALRNWGSTNRA
jgi:ABC-type multidrug transport system ATPase subunit